MRLRKLWIQDYKKYHDCWIEFGDKGDVSLLQKEIFNNMNISLFSGENGTGKTTILSFIATIFKHIQRFRERIPSDFRMLYDITISRMDYEIELVFKDKKLFMLVNKEIYYIKIFDVKDRKYIEDKEVCDCKQVTYDEIRKYLPEKIIVIGFDAAYGNLHYGNRYIGERIVDYRGLESAYGTTGRGNDYSKGVLNMLYIYSTEQKFRRLLNSLGIELSEFVDIKFNFYDNELVELSEQDSRKCVKDFWQSDWESYIIDECGYNSRFRIFDYIHYKKNYKALQYLIEQSKVYINEYYIKKNGESISISNMSTGEKAFLYNLFFLLDRIEDNTIVIWEEPETHLNMMWSKNLIPLLTQLFNKYNFHILLSSHDSHMIRNLFQNQIKRLKGNEVITPNFNTFLANEVEISKRLFEDALINPFEEYMLQKMGKQNHTEKEELMSILGESYLKFLLYKQMEK